MPLQEQTPKLTDRRAQQIFFAVCWLTYFSTYLGRLNFTASLAEISAAEGFSKAALGMVSSGFFIGYGIFQLIWGFAGDRLNPAHMVFWGIFSSGVLNLAMALCKNVAPMVILWTCNGAVQAAVWSPLLRLTLDRLPEEVSTRASIRYATTVPFGTLAAYLIAAGCAVIQSWRTDFLVSGLLLISISILWRHRMKIDAPDVRTQRTAPQPQNHGRIPQSVRLILVPICFATMVNGLIRDSVQTWMPTYLAQMHGMDGFSSIALTMILPIVNLSGVYLGTFLNDRCFKNEVLTSAFAFLAAALLLAPVIFSLTLPLWLSLILFGLCAAMMLAVNTMFVTLVPVRLQFTGRTSTLSGILNSSTYIGSALSGYGIGWLLEHVGWGAVMGSWGFGLIGAVLICLGIFRLWAGQRSRMA